MSEEQKAPKPKSKAQEKREKREKKNQQVNLPVAGEAVLNVPAYFITKRKNGKWRLLDPKTTSRNLSSSTGEPSIQILKRTILKPVLGDIGELPKEQLPKMKDFSKKDREKIETLMSSVNKGENKIIRTEAGKTRGRPIYLYKNAERAGYTKRKNLKAYGENPSAKPKKAKEGEEEEEEEEEKDMTGKRGRRKSPYLSVKQQEDDLKKTYNALKKEGKALMKVSPNALHKTISSLIGGEKRLREDFATMKEKFLSDMKEKGLIGEGVKEVFSGVVEKVKDIGHKILHGRNDYPPSFKRLLDKYGNETISRVEIYRQPILSVFSTILNLATKGEAERRLKETDKDKLFHISLWATLSNGKTLLIEKNEVLNMKENPKRAKESESIEAPTPPANLTLREMLEKTKERMGDKFFTYRAIDNNCGNFIENILQANDMDSPPVMTFIKQDAKKILEGYPRLAKAMNLITDIAGRANVVVEGGKLSQPNIQMTIEEKGKGIVSSKIQPAFSDSEIDAVVRQIKEKHPSFPRSRVYKLLRKGSVYLTDEQREKLEEAAASMGLILPKQLERGGKGKGLKKEAEEAHYPDWEHMKWGSFTKQFEAYKSSHPTGASDLEAFAKMIVADPSKYQAKTLKRARFYLNVILKKKSHSNIQGKGMIKQMKGKRPPIKSAVMSPEDLAKMRTQRALGSDPATYSPVNKSPVLSVGYGLHLHPALVSTPAHMIYHPNAMTIIHHPLGLGLYAGGLYGGGLYGHGLGGGMKEEESESESDEEKEVKGGAIPSPPSRSPITDPSLLGSGLKGRPKKGSPEAKAWGEKMRALRKK